MDALSFIVHSSVAVERGRKICEKLKKEIPRQLFEIPIQAAIGAKIVARETVSAMRKDVLAKCYGGDKMCIRDRYEASEVIKTKTYYKLLLIQTFSIPAFVLISSIFVSFGEAKGLQTEILVAGVSIASLFQVAGRFIISSISDKISSKNSMILVFIITILSVIIPVSYTHL